MRVYHNSRDISYRDPYGAIQIGGAVHLSLDIFDEKPESVAVRVWIDGEGETLVEATLAEHGGGWRASALLEPDHPAIIWYCFAIGLQSGDTLYCCPEEGRTGGEGRLVDWPASSFQLTVYEPREVEPDWFSGIAYQIFPDSFRRGKGWEKQVGKALATPRKGPERKLIEDWSSRPGYIRDDDGRVVEWDFYGGTLSGIREKLGYLAELGVTILYLNPIFEAASCHRYDIGDYLHVDPMLGTDEEFSELCREAEGYGISIILDGVFNHTGRDSRYFNAFGNYEGTGAYQKGKGPYDSWYRIGEDGQYASWWGIDDLPDLDDSDPGLQEFICGENGVVRTWLRRGARGWRLDVVDELPDSFVAQIKAAALAERPDALVMGEVWEDASNKVSYSKLRRYFLGDELDCCMNYHLREALLGYITGSFTAPELAERIESIRENYPAGAFERAFNLLGSHDTERVFTILGGAPAKDTLTDAERGAYRLDDGQRGLAKGRLWLAALLQMTLPGVPCIYYGDEAGAEGYADPYNRAAFPWGSEDDDCLTIYYNAVMARQALPAFEDGDFEALSFGDDVFGFRRRSASTGETAVVLVNRSLFDVHEVSIPMEGVYATDVVGGQMLSGQDGQLRVRLSQLGSTIVYFHDDELALVPEQGAGIICHISSLPGKGRQGSLGAPSEAFCDWLAEAGMRYWQILPVNPTDEYGSPYAGLSAFAGNTALCEGGAASAPLKASEKAAFKRFCADNASWLDAYACFMAIKDFMGEGRVWQDWPKKYRDYRPALLSDPELAEGMERHRIEQFRFQRQWDSLCEYAHARGIKIIGDMPMYVSSDSADVWAHRELFDLDERGLPARMAGAPPDNFSAEGQIWGNPTYRWDVLRETGYAWWMDRFERMLALYDIVRLDHFLGFSAYYSMAADEPATQGIWRRGPGRELFELAEKRLGKLPFIAEDLGLLTAAARSLVASCGFPGMDVVQFADGDPRYGWQVAPGRLAYSSTHDTETLVGWCMRRFGLDAEQARATAMDLMACGMALGAPVFMMQLQDAACLGDEARMNVPGTSEGNWSWRASAEVLDAARENLAELARRS